MGRSTGLVPAGRGPGRPVGADSAETRARILHAAREVISERGARFVVVSHLECARHPQLRHCGSPVVTAMRAFYESTVIGAVERHELPADTDVATVVELLNAMVWGIGFYAGFVEAKTTSRRLPSNFIGFLAVACWTVRPAAGR